MIYFDQAASSHPKPSAVGEAMLYALNEIGANPGRGGHKLAKKAANLISETRETASRIFGCSNPKKVLFYHNATAALNQAIKGMSWVKGDHIIATTFEHNSIRRPLESLKKQYGLNITYVSWCGDETSFLHRIKQSIKPETKLIAATHASNVTGAVIPVEKIALSAKQHDIPLLVDASQTAGHKMLHMKNAGIDMMAIPGHKGLLGPQGTGMLLVEGDIDLYPLNHGGTGYFSESPDQPSQWPEKLESGTLNTPGIAGLNAAMKSYEARDAENVPRETILSQVVLKGLKKIEGITCYGPDIQEERMPIVGFNVSDIPSQEIAMILDSYYNIAVRAGLHCSPLTHETLNTTEQGVVRASFSMYNTEEEVVQFLQVIQEIAESYKTL
ncbi:cysteine desulfurase [Lentibacillus kapialis]|uniref:cysteine desulfurase n=1 Tax=Lentibacillus kapialis TaxID=340214 RepID=A0A917PS49_9BACI|nr:aminotransferase class V-fold PLP-dependent enzyme [Lentibacillus kapialis]GGJ89669.1 cysteine desulfurase [Lentibacillus kapialis]